jgi:aspartyl-tRNA(Asn)/glutamyl-tRNA(Gln) amidotransferase subunit A
MDVMSRRAPSVNVVAASDPMAARDDARTSAARLARGAPRPLEGVPFLVKDQQDVAGMPTSFGSRRASGVALRDATFVARLRAAGAVVLGKATMTEWGISPLGNNVHCELPLNPHAPERAAGGSSTGSAVAVALGLGPFATGGDAGGSVRIPAALTGVHGIKPTFGRVSRAGEAFSGSLNHVGALAATAEDLARFLDVAASTPDPLDPMTTWATPPPDGGFGARLGDGVRGLRIGVDESEWRDADPEVSRACREALAALERDGATLVPIRVPLSPHAPAIGITTAACEGVALAETVDPEVRACLAPDVQLAMNVARGITAREYLDVQRLRSGLREQLAEALLDVDVIAIPTVASSAPLLSERERTESFSDPGLLLSVFRHAFLANLTGLPAATAPVGVDAHGVPIGLQIVGDAWDEASVLAVTAHLERAGVSEVRRPPGAVDLVDAISRRAPGIEGGDDGSEGEWDAVVIGGGFCGVHCAAEIERRLPDARVLLIEASERLGGRARSFVPPESPFALDLGAHYLGRDHTRAMALAHRLLRDDQIYSNVAQYGPDPACRNYLEGRYRTTTKKTSYLQLQGLSREVAWEHRVRIFESLTEYLALEAAVDLREPWRTPGAAELDSMTVREWVESQRMPRWIEEMWGLAVLDIISIRPEQISMLYWLWYNAANRGFLKVADDHVGGPQEYSLTVGLEGLLERHAAELHGTTLTGTPVVEVRHDDPDRVRVVTRDGRRFEARAAVVAVSPNAAGRHLRFEPELDEARRLLHAQPMGHATKAVLVYDRPWWRDDGLRFMSYSAGADAEGVEWALDTSHPSGVAFSLSAFVSDRLMDRAGGDPEAIREAICASMVELCGDPRAGRPTHIEVWDWRAHPWVGGGPNTSFGPGVLSRVGGVFRRPERPHGRLHFAAAEYASEFPGYVEGALASAEETATLVCTDLARELDRPLAPQPAARPLEAPRALVAGAMRVARHALGPAILAADAARVLRGRDRAL